MNDAKDSDGTERHDPGRSGNDLKFDGFISYSHSGSAAIAQALQSELEKFAKPWYRVRRLRIFRDKSNLAASPHLWDGIVSALKVSNWFILIASPAAANSPWVASEVKWWLANKSPSRILIAQTSGEMKWRYGDIDWSVTDSLPHVLAGVFRSEPLWVDLRQLTPGESDSTLHIGDLVAEFASPLLEIPKDELIGENVRERRRLRRTIRATFAVLVTLLVLAIGGGIVAVDQRNEAIRQRDAAYSREIASEAEDLRLSRPDLSLLLDVEAMKISPTSQARSGLTKTLLESEYSGFLPGTGRVDTVVASPLAGIIATTDEEGVKLWNIANPMQKVLVGSIDVGLAAKIGGFTSNGKILAVDRQGETSLWDISDAKYPKRISEISAGGSAVTANTKMNYLFDGSTLWDVKDPVHPIRMSEVSSGASAAKISKDGSMLILAQRTGSEIWDIQDPAKPTRLGTAGPSEDVGVSPDGHWIVTAPRDLAPQLWDIADRAHPRLIGNLDDVPKISALGVEFSPDGQSLAAATSEGTIVWDLRDPLHPAVSHRLHGHPHATFGVAFTPDGRNLITVGQDDRAFIWRLTVGEAMETLSQIGPYDGGVPTIVRFIPGGAPTLLTSGDAIPTTLWDISNRAQPVALSTIGGTFDGTFDIQISSDGSTLLRYINGQPLQIWDIRSREKPVKIIDAQNMVGSPIITPHGDYVGIYSGTGSPCSNCGGLAIYDFSDRAHPSLVSRAGSEAVRVYRARFSPDGRLLAMVSDDGTTLWDITDVKSPRLLGRLPSKAAAISFSPDSKVLAISGGGLTFALWDVSQPADPQVISSIPGEGGIDVAFAPNGLVLGTGSSAVFGTLWNISDLRHPIKIVDVTGHSGSVYNLAISPDGRTLVTGSFDKTARLWSLPDDAETLADPVKAACAITGPDLDDADWKQYLAGIPREQVCR